MRATVLQTQKNNKNLNKSATVIFTPACAV